MHRTRPVVTALGLVLSLPVLASHSVSISVSPNLCNGDAAATASADVSGGSGKFQYDWEHGATSQMATNLGAGAVGVTVTDLDDGHQATAAAMVVDPTALSATINVGDSTCYDSCDGSAYVDPSGGTPGYTFLWHNNETGNSISGLCGSISVTVTDENGCTYGAADDIEQPPTPMVTHALSQTSTAQTCDGMIELFVTSGTSPFSAVTWSYESAPLGTVPDNCTTTPSCIGTLGTLCTGAYRAQFTDANACAITHDIDVTALPIEVFADSFEA